MKFKLKDPGSAITHGIALLLAAVGAVPLIIKAARSYDVLHIVALSIFILTMVLLYAASTIYHSVDSTEKVNRRLRKMDHMMIFVMIAGSYTPVCLIVLHNRIGYILCALVWSIAVLGIILKGCWITCPKWLSSVLYIAMGWLCVLAFVPIFHALPRAGFDWLLAGGIILYHRWCDLCIKSSYFLIPDIRILVPMRSFTSLLCLEVPAISLSCTFLLLHYLYNRQFTNKQNKGLQHRIFSGATTP